MKEVPAVGSLITSDDVKRDAIHIAVVPAIANENMFPGQKVGFFMNLGLVGIKRFLASPKADKLVGIVDPYLSRPVFQGEKFWVFVFPNTITSLRHEWSHPDIPDTTVPVVYEPGRPISDETMERYKDQITKDIHEKNIEISKKWLEDYAKELGLFDYEELVSMGKHGHITGHGMDHDGEKIKEGFWEHIYVVTGKRPEYKDEYIGCSC